MSRFDATTEPPPTLASADVSDGGRRLTAELIQITAIVLDLLVIWAAALGSEAVWSGEPFFWRDVFDGVTAVGMAGGLLVVGYLMVRRAYAVSNLADPSHQLRMVTEAWLFSFFVLGWLAFLMQTSADFSRGVVSLFFVSGGGAIAFVHGFGAHWLRRRFVRGTVSLRRVAVITLADVTAFDRIRRRLVAKGIEVVSSTAISPACIGKPSFLAMCRAAEGDVRAALASTKIDGIYLFVSWRERRHIEELQSALGPMPVPIYLFADRMTETLLQRPQLRVGPMRAFELQRAPLTRLDRAMKRTMDILVAGSALVLLSPLMGLVSLAIVLESGRPIIFRQTRKGFGARPFEIMKFRSMTVQENGSVVKQASRGDARITRLGGVLRKTSIDELPQLFNVLKGDMSIVGPRPHAVAHDDYYDGIIATYAFRQHVKPGITGWAQINGHRGETREVGQMSARVEHDLWYINHWSPWLDVKIAVMTVGKVLNDKTAF